MNSNLLRRAIFSNFLPLVILLIALAACAVPTSENLEIGIAQSDVLRLLGEPDRTQDFNFPDEPFFGPQESLTGLVEADEAVLEWVYEQGDEELYIWFAGGPGWPRSSFRVVAYATYPTGAVF